MCFTVLYVVHNGSQVLEYTVVHTVQAADTSLLFECTMLHSKPGAQTAGSTLVCTLLDFTLYKTTPRLEHTVVHTVQAADTSLLFKCTMLHSKP